MTYSDRNKLFLDAVKAKNHDLVRYFLTQGVDPACQGNYAIYTAAKSNNLAMVNLLLGMGVNPQDTSGDINGTASTPIRAACCFGYSDIVERLLQDERVDTSQRHSRALRRAVGGGYTTIVKALLEHGKADPAAHHSEALRLACAKGHADIVDLLLADPRTQPNTISGSYMNVEKGASPVYIAILKLPQGGLRIVKALFQHKDVEPLMYKEALKEALSVNNSDALSVNNSDAKVLLSALLAQADHQQQAKEAATTTETIVVNEPSTATPATQTIRIEINVRQEEMPAVAKQRRTLVAKQSKLEKNLHYITYVAGEILTVLFEDAFPSGHYYMEKCNGDVGYACKSHFF